MADDPIDITTEQELLAGLKKLGGRGTLGDVVRVTGLPREKTEADLKTMLGLYRSHLEVDENGELLYLFDPSFERRVQVDWIKSTIRSVMKWGWEVFVIVFKFSIMAMLVTYVVAFCVLIIAAFIALLTVGDGDGLDFDFGGEAAGGCFQFIFEIFYFWNVGEILYVPLLWTEQGSSGQRLNRNLPRAFWEPGALEPKYVTDTYEAKRNRQPHFYEKVFAFIFGPTIPDPPRNVADKEILAYIHDKRGVLTLTELIARTGMQREKAEEEMTRLLLRFGGDVNITDEGHLLYTFHDLRVTGQEDGAKKAMDRPAPPAWHRFEPDPQLTGNSTGSNALIGGMALFTMFGAIGTTMAAGFAPVMLPLTIIPMLMSLAFFMIPAGRWAVGQGEKGPRQQRNLRRALLLVIFEHLVQGHGELTMERVYEDTRNVLGVLQKNRSKGALDEGERRKMANLEHAPREAMRVELQALLTELGAEREEGPGGQIVLRFPEQSGELAAAEAARKNIRTSTNRLGEIIYSTADDDDDPLEDRFEEELGGDLTLPETAEESAVEAPQNAEVGAKSGK